MKNTFKTTFSLALFALGITALPAAGGGFRQESFVNPSIVSFFVSTNIGATNLLTTAVTPNGTNINGMIYTNRAPYISYGTNPVAGPQVIVTATAAKIGWNTNYPAGPIYTTNSTVNLLKDVDLFVDANDSATPMPGTTASTNAYGAIFITLTGSSVSSTGTVNFVFATIPDGITEMVTADLPAIAVTATGTTPATSKTLVPAGYLTGCKGIRLRSVYSAVGANNDTEYWVTGCKYLGWSP